MSRFRRTLGALVLGSLLVNGGIAVHAQDTAADANLRAQMAAITLDESALPDGFAFVGETFLTADQVASGDLDAAALTDAGFVSQYLSVYRNGTEGVQIRTYASAWTDAAAAEAGFGVIEDEGRTNPGADLSDGDASIGEEPRETTTGSYPDPADESVTINTADVTFRVDRFLVGVAVETTNGEPADTELAGALAAEVEGRATGTIGSQNPDGTDLELVPQVLPLQGLGRELQAGFLSPAEVEELYGLRGSALGSYTASWAQAVGLGEGDALQPFIVVGMTTFEADTDAQTVVEQAAELSPAIEGIEAVDGVTVEGAEQAVAYRFPSPAVGATAIDSFRVIFAVGTNVGVVDVQGAPSADMAQQVATDLASAQAACVGQTSCAAPTLPDELTEQE
jgi:hypothetical protein